ncbi:hypothetical protein VOLCADRAFT_86140 [Volvox carteri f. nagariensis]|uniref:Glycine zipper domain-containing protein n=1 Tax=Volvox carteri f. nagariensis TaxID=3068 RepID=D8THZ1_VOLCA|nr:uncharacterized protein VOLCADRAFT_86140 [Volvox carteri f. nagariensis]EFJ53151.1 hypothetical protein VOLCADRAFT_86140 [Volvox carteri f. nagariensis]|eukprot:XP_002946156.1 hypothetical protein VOLCADRAFT_86140 [Volvox carteri f. nagariensis]
MLKRGNNSYSRTDASGLRKKQQQLHHHHQQQKKKKKQAAAESTTSPPHSNRVRTGAAQPRNLVCLAVRARSARLVAEESHRVRSSAPAPPPTQGADSSRYSAAAADKARAPSVRCHATSSSRSSSGGRAEEGPSAREVAEAEFAETGASSTASSTTAAAGSELPGDRKMDPQHRQTVEVVEVDVIEGENGEPGSSMLGTVAGTAAGAALAGSLAAAAALSVPLAAAAAAVGAVVGAVAGGAMGKEVPRGVDVDRAMEFDQPEVVRAGQEAEEQDALTETVWDSASAPPSAPPSGAVGARGGRAGEGEGEGGGGGVAVTVVEVVAVVMQAAVLGRGGIA